MLPEPIIINDVVTTPFLYPRSKRYPMTQSWEQGGVALSDPSEPLNKYNWYAWTDSEKIYCKRADLDDIHTLITDSNITEIDFTFDQNMRPCVTYVADNVAKLYWYNSEIHDYDKTICDDATNPRVSLDDKRRFNVANSDIIFAYLKNGVLHYRLQRERYKNEHSLGVKARRLVKIGMGTKLRFLFYIQTAN